MNSRQRPRRQTFAEIVAAVDAASSASQEEAVIEPGAYNGSVLYDPEGRELSSTDGRALEPAEVQSAVLAGARLVWDPCGCGGYCHELEWPDRLALRREAERSLPRFRRQDPVRVEVLTGSGGDVLLATGGLRWGNVVS